MLFFTLNEKLFFYIFISRDFSACIFKPILVNHMSEKVVQIINNIIINLYNKSECQNSFCTLNISFLFSLTYHCLIFFLTQFIYHFHIFSCILQKLLNNILSFLIILNVRWAEIFFGNFLLFFSVFCYLISAIHTLTQFC